MLCGTRNTGMTGMREGLWERKQLGEELGETSVLGLGRIGAEVAKRAQAFEMRAAYDPYLTEDRAKEMDLEKVELDRLLQKQIILRSYAHDRSN